MTAGPPASSKPCVRCGAIGFRDLLDEGFCTTHYAAVLRSFDPASFGDIGMMLPVGRARPEFGPAMFDAQCVRCGATGVASPGEQCPWCAAMREHRDAHQAELLLSPPDVDPSDRTFETVMRAWAGRMLRGVEADLITKGNARRAWERMRTVVDEQAA